MARKDRLRSASKRGVSGTDLFLPVLLLALGAALAYISDHLGLEEKLGTITWISRESPLTYEGITIEHEQAYHAQDTAPTVLEDKCDVIEPDEVRTVGGDGQDEESLRDSYHGLRIEGKSVCIRVGEEAVFSGVAVKVIEIDGLALNTEGSRPVTHHFSRVRLRPADPFISPLLLELVAGGLIGISITTAATELSGKRRRIESNSTTIDGEGVEGARVSQGET